MERRRHNYGMWCNTIKIIPCSISARSIKCLSPPFPPLLSKDSIPSLREKLETVSIMLSGLTVSKAIILNMCLHQIERHRGDHFDLLKPAILFPLLAPTATAKYMCLLLTGHYKRVRSIPFVMEFFSFMHFFVCFFFTLASISF